jgi:carboxynorspermidine decarboxylase
MEGWMAALPTPCYIVDEGRLIKNLALLKSVAQRSGCKVLLAQKAFSMFSLYPLMRQYLDGTAASGLFEARLGAEHFGGETHVYSPAYKAEDMAKIVRICGHIVFNSFGQWERFKAQALSAGCECGLRINPERSTQACAIYDPCAPGSRLGITAANFQPDKLDGISGLHMHTLCEQNADALAATLQAAEEGFGAYFRRMKWINLGGGHHITRTDYDVDLLVSELIRIRDRYDVQVYIEPGEAVALCTGFLVCSVLDIIKNDVDIAILDTSAACHMPDVREMPYRPQIIGAALGRKAYAAAFGADCLRGRHHRGLLLRRAA